MQGYFLTMSKEKIQFISYLTIRAIISLFLIIPHEIRLRLLGFSCWMFLKFSKQYRTICFYNLRQVFPENTLRQNTQLLRKSCKSIGRLISDSLRLPKLSASWCEKNINFSNRADLRLVEEKKSPILFVSGHIGSFELLGHYLGIIGHPVAVVARSFKNPYLDEYFRNIRTGSGNTVIARNGAVRRLVSALNSGRSVALLADQNVTRKHAVFVEWFGRSAATSVAPAIAALRSPCLIYIISIEYRHSRYEIVMTPCPVDDITKSHEITEDEKIKSITARVSNILCDHIRSYPEGWFWMHRRWKTVPEGQQEDFYEKSLKVASLK